MITIAWWVVWSFAGQPSILQSHWLSILILVVAVDLLLARDDD